MTRPSCWHGACRSPIGSVRSERVPNGLARKGFGLVAHRHGFTLIELVMVLVIIGLLASVLIPRFANSREKAIVAAMKSDLRNLATAEESYFYDQLSYTTTLGNLASFRPSAGVTITVGQATMGGWSATATHANVTRQCFLFVGNASPVGSATQEGQIACN
jgi:prepilin-type N-terminal cleavage/methylation domain-containing protein